MNDIAADDVQVIIAWLVSIWRSSGIHISSRLRRRRRSERMASAASGSGEDSIDNASMAITVRIDSWWIRAGS